MMIVFLFSVYFTISILVRGLLGSKLTDSTIALEQTYLDKLDLYDFAQRISNANDFTDWNTQIYVARHIVGQVVPVEAMIVVLNCAWVAYGVTRLWKSLGNKSVEKGFIGMYCLLPLCLFGILPFSFRDSYLLGLVLILLSGCVEAGRGKNSLGNSLVVIASVYLVYRTRPEFGYLFGVLIAATVVTRDMSVIDILVGSWSKISGWFGRMTKGYFPRIVMRQKVLLRGAGLICLIFTILLLVSFLSRSMLGRLISVSDASIVDSLQAYQEVRIARGESYGSGSDIVGTDEFKKMSLGSRLGLQLANNLITPLRVTPITVPKAAALIDSVIYLSIWSKLITRIANESNRGQPRKEANAVVLWSMMTLACFSIIISNGGNAFRYKSFWAVPLTIVLYSSVKDQTTASQPRGGW